MLALVAPAEAAKAREVLMGLDLATASMAVCKQVDSYKLT